MIFSAIHLLIFVLLLLGNTAVTIAVQLYMLYSLLSHIFWLPGPEGKGCEVCLRCVWKVKAIGVEHQYET